jgi:hypothetical protein
VRDAFGRRPVDDHELPPSVGTFLRGLSLGALVGAMIAGSALLRRRARQGADPDEPRRVGPPA